MANNMMSAYHHCSAVGYSGVSQRKARKAMTVKITSATYYGMFFAHRALRDQMFQNTLMPSSDAVTLFDAGVGQVCISNSNANAKAPVDPNRRLTIAGTRESRSSGGLLYCDPPGTVPRRDSRQAGVLRHLRWTVRLPFPLLYSSPTGTFLIGHCSGSGLVADHASKWLHRLLALRPEFEQGDYAEALKAALADEDGLLLESFKHDSAEPALSGSTAAICLINLTAGELVVSNLGDSHVLLAERDPKTECPYHIVGVYPPLSSPTPLSPLEKED
jgi:hypothetical protein